VTAGCFHDADALVNGPPVTAYPDQFELVEFVVPATRGGWTSVGVADAVVAANSTTRLTTPTTTHRITRWLSHHALRGACNSGVSRRPLITDSGSHPGPAGA
jgi:hypothetical protein